MTIGIDLGSSCTRVAFWHEGIPEAAVLPSLKEAKEKKAFFSISNASDAACREQLEKTARQAGLEVLGYVPAVTAAALAYSHLKKRRGVIAVTIFGALFFEFGIVRLLEKEIQVLALEGLALGGDDLDQSVAKNLSKELKVPFENLLAESEKARCALSHRGSYDLKCGRALSRFELVKWVREDVEKIAAVCKSAVKKTGLTPRDIEEVIFAGGVTRMPLVQVTVEKIFQKKGNMEINPDLAVVYGTLISGQHEG